MFWVSLAANVWTRNIGVWFVLICGGLLFFVVVLASPFFFFPSLKPSSGFFWLPVKQYLCLLQIFVEFGERVHAGLFLCRTEIFVANFQDLIWRCCFASLALSWNWKTEL